MKRKLSIAGAILLMTASWLLFTYACLGSPHKPARIPPPRFGNEEIVRLTDGRMAVVKCRKFSTADHVWIYTISILTK